MPSTYVLAVGTDGSDGMTTDAGALIDGETCERIELAGFDSQLALARADSGTVLEAAGDLIHTGPTGTNVCDLLLGLRYGSARRARHE
jgi:hydroxypyruvate reductase